MPHIVLTVISVLFFLLVNVNMSGADELLINSSEILGSSPDTDWRTVDQSRLLYLQLDAGRVVFELADEFAPDVIANIRELTEQAYFDGLAIVRVQDNYVVQLADPLAGKDGARDLGRAKQALQPEFFRSRRGLDIVPLESRDTYADEVGYVGGFPVASDGERAWLPHCYGMLGVGREVAPDSGNGAELYVVIGHAPRHLDRNVTLIGRTLYGIELLSTLPRGTGFLGFYETDAEQVAIRQLRFGDQLDEPERMPLQVLRPDSSTFAEYAKARTFRRESWFADPVGKIEICNLPLPVRNLPE